MSEHRTFFKIEGVKAVYDLSSGYGGSDKIGTYDGQVPIYSAEGFLCAIEEVCETTNSALVHPVWLGMDKVYKGRNYL